MLSFDWGMSSYFIIVFMIIVWNAIGAAGKAFSNVVKKIKMRYRPDILVCQGVSGYFGITQALA